MADRDALQIDIIHISQANGSSPEAQLLRHFLLEQLHPVGVDRPFTFNGNVGKAALRTIPGVNEAGVT
ncbi:hypothetical protein D3C71_2053050 [compost metagenome]